MDRELASGRTIGRRPTRWSASALIVLAGVALAGVALAACSSSNGEKASNAPTGWSTFRSGPVSIELPPRFVRGGRARVERLSTHLADDMFKTTVLSAVRGQSAKGSSLDVVGIKKLPAGTVLTAAGLRAGFPGATVETVALPAAQAHLWSVPPFPATNAQGAPLDAGKHWAIAVGGDTYTLDVDRIGSGDPVPEADQIAQSFRFR